MNILAISGSLRKNSSNHLILRHIGELMPVDVDYQVYQGLSSIPPFDPGTDNENPPQPVAELRKLLNEADGIIICTPEYAYGVPGQLKNAIDWMVSSASFSGKLTALITASTGGETAHAALLKILGAVDAKVNVDATLLISFVRSKIDADGKLTNQETINAIESVVNSLVSGSSAS